MELGRALAKMGEKEAALKELEQAMDMEVEDINAHLQKVLPGLPFMPCNKGASQWVCQSKIALDILVTCGLQDAFQSVRCPLLHCFHSPK